MSTCCARFKKASGCELFSKAPNDFRAAIVILFLESYVMFNFFNILMWVLTQDVGFTDRQAGWIFGTYGFSVSVFSVMLGPLVDRLQIRKTLLIHISLGLLSTLILGFTLHKIAVCIVLYGPLSICMAMGVPVVPVALRRYTRSSYHTIAFSAHYVIMNIGAALSQPTVDAFRLGVSRYVGASWMLGRPLWSYFLLCNTLLHGVSLLVTFIWIRDVEVVEASDANKNSDGNDGVTTDGRWAVQPTHYNANQSWSELRAKLGNIFRGPMLWRFVILSLALVGAKAVYVYLISLYPLYMERAPFPVPNPADMPFMTFLLINPIIVIAMTYPVGALITHFGWDRFWVIVLGSTLSAGAPFFMMITQYWAVFCFIIVISIAEPIWSPVYNKYTLEFTQKGKEGVFFGLATIPLFVAKLVTGFLSGELLQRYCPLPGTSHAPNGCGQGHMIWLIIGCLTVSSPLLLIATQRWTWLRPAHLAGKLTEEAFVDIMGDNVEMIDLESEDQEDLFCDVVNDLE